MNQANAIALHGECWHGGRRQHRGPILLPFAGANHDLLAVQIDIHHAERTAFVDAQSAAIE